MIVCNEFSTNPIKGVIGNEDRDALCMYEMFPTNPIKGVIGNSCRKFQGKEYDF